jgi:hypothetical protein
MSLTGVLEWFDSQPAETQIFIGLFVLCMAMPIALLTLLQLVESLRNLRSGFRKRDKD